jgi:hypothetical protein
MLILSNSIAKYGSRYILVALFRKYRLSPFADIID